MLKGLFGGPKTFLAQEDEAWHVSVWAWLVEHLGGLKPVLEASLVTPTTTFFPSTGSQGHDRALEVFEQVKALSGLDHWPCELVAQPERPDPVVSRFMVLQNQEGALPLGTFGPDGNAVVVTYDPGLLQDPLGLVATLAHELAHYLLSSIPVPPPGGEEMEEFATDVAVAYMGFGVFGAATSWRFKAHGDAFSQGWQTSGAGYLRQRDWAFALATFLALRGEDAKLVKPWLEPALGEEVEKALRSITRRPELLDPVREADARALAIAEA